MPPAQRVWAIDALRGLALFGVLAINLDTEFRRTVFEQFLAPPPESAVDHMAATALSFAFEFKAISLFSMLFGVGLAIQHERLADHPRGGVLLIRRLLALLGFGLIHMFLIWNGDILTEYALAGFVVLPALFAPARLSLMGSVAFVFAYAAMPWIPLPFSFPDGGWLTHHALEARAIYSSGSFLDILRLRIAEVPQIAKLHVYIFPRTLALILLGAWLWRSGAIREMGKRPAALLASGLLLTAAGLFLTAQEKGYFEWHPDWAHASPALRFALSLLNGMTPVMTAFGYAALILAASGYGRARSALQWAVPIGRMAFSNYIAQSAILCLLFYGYGLGWMSNTGAAAGLGVACGLFAIQAVISRIWLRTHRFGPLEWLWRTLMYGQRQPWHRPAGSKRTASVVSRH
ncbi:DUF418 domain-containing protein [Novosphingobium beihaiensis]|uniref:DUF418 domain-containing protein n=1 Tax=Novosphingobium beihaiensis TaxID=2930389 RepID=A0ABT0BJX4_9SPHN|nr:DUF418 domain-containing protein [Novosphingobium beihaiensis]MCJ2185349.1 DUF418 domain-containing protein [Novosphingobium beihaiensis]